MTKQPVLRSFAWDVLNRGEPYQPFNWQLKHVHTRQEKRVILPCGRRSGKSTAGVTATWDELLQPPITVHGKEQNPLVYVLAPTQELAMKIWEPFWESTFIPELDELVRDRNKKRMFVDLKTGARAQAKSADNAISVQGDRVTAVLADEAQDIIEEAWNRLIPSLLDSQGRLIAFGIPKGKGRFRSYYALGQQAENRDAEEIDYYSACVPSQANPTINTAQIEAMRKELTEDEFQQQIMAAWIDIEGTVFRNVDECFDGEFRDYQPGHRYYMGLDLAKEHDFTVAYIFDVTEQMLVYRYRVNKLDYPDVEEHVARIYRDYHCRVLHMDATGVGAGPAGHLRRMGCHVVEFKYTNESKARLLGALNAEMQHRRVHFAAEDDQLRKELKMVEASILPGGGVRYDHPAGYYDDCVQAAALAIYLGIQRVTTNTPTKSYATFTGKNRRRRRRVLRGGKMVRA